MLSAREVVEIVLDVRALGDHEAHLAEDRGDLLGHLADRVDAAVGLRAHRQGDVDPLGEQAMVEVGGFQLGLARCDRLGDRPLELVVARADRTPGLGLDVCRGSWSGW